MSCASWFRGVGLRSGLVAAVGANQASVWEPVVAKRLGEELHTTPKKNATYQDSIQFGKGSSSTFQDGADDFQRHSDLYLGGLWNKIERGLRQMEGEDFEFDITMKNGELRLKLPDQAEILIKKNPNEASLVVHSNMNDYYGSHDPDQEVSFKFCNGTFETDGEPLHAYIEDGLAKHLKIQVDLEPDVDPALGGQSS